MLYQHSPSRQVLKSDHVVKDRAVQWWSYLLALIVHTCEEGTAMGVMIVPSL
jgi:hypothetical protein